MREEYRVYYENYEELAQEEPGAEIPLQKDIVWENKNSQSERWKVLSVFACPQGLVLELAKQVASKQYLAFYEKWKEADEDRLTDRQLSQIEVESPLGECPAVLLTCNGEELQSDGTMGMGWYPSDILEKLEWEQDPEAEACRQHYGLDPAYLWWIGRFHFMWKQPVAASKIQNLVLTLQAEEKRIYGEESFILRTGDQIRFSHPVTGQTYRLDVLEIAEEEIPAERMPDNDICYPRFAQSMRYKLTPDDPAVSLEDDSPAERIYKKNPDGSQSEVSGATSFFLMGKLKPEKQNRLTTGNLHYAPVTETAWIPVFEVKRKEDITVEAMLGHKN